MLDLVVVVVQRFNIIHHVDLLQHVVSYCICLHHSWIAIMIESIIIVANFSTTNFDYLGRI